MISLFSQKQKDPISHKQQQLISHKQQRPITHKQQQLITNRLQHRLQLKQKVQPEEAIQNNSNIHKKSIKQLIRYQQQQKYQCKDSSKIHEQKYSEQGTDYFKKKFQNNPFQQQKIEYLQNIQISKIQANNGQYEENYQFTQRQSQNNDDPLNLDNKWEYFLNKHNMNDINDANYVNQGESIYNNNIQGQDPNRFNNDRTAIGFQITKGLKDRESQNIRNQKYKNFVLDEFQTAHEQVDTNRSKEYLKTLNAQQKQKLNYKQYPQAGQHIQQKKEELRQFFDRMKPQFPIVSVNSNQDLSNSNRNSNKDEIYERKEIIDKVHEKPRQTAQIRDQEKQKPKQFQQSFQEQSNITDSTMQLDFSYRYLNAEKVSYMLETTANPYPHLRTLVLIPFKSSPKKQPFLKELLHYMHQLNFQNFKTGKPFESIVLLTILLFSQIKQDKGLIGPLQSLYEFVAKQSTTNQFLKIIVSLFHSVIEETLPQNRKFLITILLKSMIRMIPFVQSSLQLLRDVQQFYQIGQMVYFQMFQQEYSQIRDYLQGEALQIMIQKVWQQRDNISLVIQGFMTTQFKKRALQKLQEFKNSESVQEYSIIDNQQEQGQQKIEKYDREFQSDQQNKSNKRNQNEYQSKQY